MSVIPASGDKKFRFRTKSDAILTDEENFKRLRNALAEPFVVFDDAESGFLSSAFSFDLCGVRNGMARFWRLSAAPCVLSYSLKRNSYHGYVQILAALKGEISIRIDASKVFKLKSSEAILFDPTSEIRLCLSKSAEVGSVLLASNWLHAQCGYLSALVPEMRVTEETATETILIEGIRTVFEVLPDLSPDHLESICDGLGCFLRPIFDKTFRQVQASPHTSRTDFLRACAEEAMLSEMGNPALSAEDIALRVGVSSRYLRRLFEEIGSTLGDRLLAMRLERASTQLRLDVNKGKTIAEIARQCGFVNASHFGRVFKSRYGRTPKEWRTRL